MCEAKTYPIIRYDSVGNEIYREELNGHWVKRKFDEKGRQIYWETNRGGWAKHRFDDAGNEIYYENSDGFWFKCEYDSNGFRTYYEDSDGKIKGNRQVDELISSATNKSNILSFNTVKTENQDIYKENR